MFSVRHFQGSSIHVAHIELKAWLQLTDVAHVLHRRSSDIACLCLPNEMRLIGVKQGQRRRTFVETGGLLRALKTCSPALALESSMFMDWVAHLDSEGRLYSMDDGHVSIYGVGDTEVFFAAPQLAPSQGSDWEELERSIEKSLRCDVPLRGYYSDGEPIDSRPDKPEQTDYSNVDAYTLDLRQWIQWKVEHLKMQGLGVHDYFVSHLSAVEYNAVYLQLQQVGYSVNVCEASPSSGGLDPLMQHPALSLAFMHGRVDLLSTLLNFGADPYKEYPVRTPSGRGYRMVTTTPMDILCKLVVHHRRSDFSKYRDMLWFFLEHGFSLNRKKKQGEETLMAYLQKKGVVLIPPSSGISAGHLLDDALDGKQTVGMDDVLALLRTHA